MATFNDNIYIWNDVLTLSQIAETKSSTTYNYIGADRTDNINIFTLFFNTTETTPYRRIPGDPGYGGISIAGSIFNASIVAIPGKVQGDL